MKVKITHPLPDRLAGLIYDLPDEEAQEIIKKDFGFAVEEVGESVTTYSDEHPAYIEPAPKRKVKK